jgi:hypothetical protein
VPRYLHESFKKHAEPEFVEAVAFERWQHRRYVSRDELDAAEANAKSRLSIQSQGRKYGL